MGNTKQEAYILFHVSKAYNYTLRYIPAFLQQYVYAQE
jgi:hypothetical protein